ncbi:MAG: OmpH family outer membrane protein [Bacteroidota bacterium]
MKNKTLLAIAILLGLSFSVKAQTALKIGYVDTDYVFTQMPEAKQVESQLQSHNTQLQNRLKAKYQDYQTKLTKYQEELQANPNMDATIRQDKENSLLRLQEEIAKFEQDANVSLQQKQEQLMSPIYTKVGNAIEAVAKENGFTHIFRSKLGTADIILYVDDQYDASNLVLKKMGITPTAN